MTVNHRFAFTEDELRTIRAAIGRGGKATRKECAVFINRAVKAALDAAPEPKAKRVKRVKTDPSARPVVVDEHADAIAQRNRIARLYRHSVTRVVEKLEERGYDLDDVGGQTVDEIAADLAREGRA